MLMGATHFATPARRWAALISLTLLGLVGCDSRSPQSWVNPQGPYASAIYDLFLPIFITAVVVFVVVQGLIVYSVFKFRERPGGPPAQQFHGNLTIELTSTIITALVFIVVLAMTVNTQRVLSAPLETPPADAIRVKAIGHQWWWEFEYQDSGFVTASDMVIPTGTTVIVEVTAADVIHAFWVPMLTGQVAGIPGRTNHIWLKSEKDGTYAGVCNQFCGIQHALMRYAAISVPRPEFDAWVERQRMAPVTPVSSPNADQSLVLQAKGAQLFAAGACKTCHMIRGTDAIGKVGPDLTHFSSRTSIASKTLPSTVENVKAWLRNPQAVKPGTIMPNLNLKEEDIDALTAYLCRPVDPSINSGCQVVPTNAAKK